MDRRQKKTRLAILNAFAALLSENHYNSITVQDIIDGADIGRTTFYAHFETKDFLLKELCEELFDHIIDTAMGEQNHIHCDFESSGQPFLHLLRHIGKNDYNILKLLSSQNNEIFLKYFKSNLKKLIVSRYSDTGLLANSPLPEDYLINHISSSFVETVSWWVQDGCVTVPEKIDEYFNMVINPIIK